MTFNIYALKTFSHMTKLDPLDIYYTVRKGMEELVKKGEIRRRVYNGKNGCRWVCSKSGSVVLTAVEHHKPRSDHFTARVFDESGRYIGGSHFSVTSPPVFQPVHLDSKNSTWRGTSIWKRKERMEDLHDVIVRHIQKKR